MRGLLVVLIFVVGLGTYTVFVSGGDSPAETAKPTVVSKAAGGSEAPSAEPNQPTDKSTDVSALDASYGRKESEDPDQSEASVGAAEAEETGVLDEAQLDDLADWSGPWSKLVERSRREVLDPKSTLDEKGSAFKALQMLRSDKDEDPRTEEILLEAAWILNNTSDAGVLDDVLDGIEETQHDRLVEPLIDCLVNHSDAKVRSGAANVLLSYRDSDRVQVAMEHAAQYDENERVRTVAARY